MTSPRRLVASLVHTSRSSAERACLEDAVRRVYASAYDARISECLPLLLGLRDERGALAGVIGAQPGADPAPLFLQVYLDRPVEQALSHALGGEVPRDRLAEVGNLSAVQPGMGMPLVSTLAEWFGGAGIEHAVFTATGALRASFLRRGIVLTDLGPADGARLGARVADWGRYYATEPRVTAVEVAELRRTIRRDEHLAGRCERVWDEAFRLGMRARSAA